MKMTDPFSEDDTKEGGEQLTKLSTGVSVGAIEPAENVYIDEINRLRRLRNLRSMRVCPELKKITYIQCMVISLDKGTNKKRMVKAVTIKENQYRAKDAGAVYRSLLTGRLAVGFSYCMSEFARSFAVSIMYGKNDLINVSQVFEFEVPSSSFSIPVCPLGESQGRHSDARKSGDGEESDSGGFNFGPSDIEDKDTELDVDEEGTSRNRPTIIVPGGHSFHSSNKGSLRHLKKKIMLCALKQIPDKNGHILYRTDELRGTWTDGLFCATDAVNSLSLHRDQQEFNIKDFVLGALTLKGNQRHIPDDRGVNVAVIQQSIRNRRIPFELHQRKSLVGTEGKAIRLFKERTGMYLILVEVEVEGGSSASHWITFNAWTRTIFDNDRDPRKHYCVLDEKDVESESSIRKVLHDIGVEKVMEAYVVKVVAKKAGRTWHK